MDEVEELIGQLKSEDICVGAKAIERLGEFKDRRAVFALIGAALGRSPGLRSIAAWKLRDIGDPSAVSVLIEVLKSENLGSQEEAAGALEKIGKIAIPRLIETLRNENVYARVYAAELLEKIAKQCKTIEDLEEAEMLLEKGSVVLRKGRIDRDILIYAQVCLAKLTREIAKKKDQLAPKKDLLLDDKPKPPKRGRGVYQTVRRTISR